jgi:hypothetical protein
MRLADRILETSTTTGTGALTLAGAATGYQTFAARYADGDRFPYVIELQGGSEWEVGTGFVSGGTLVRDAVQESSNADALVSFSAGTKNVFVGITEATQRGYGKHIAMSSITRY